MELAIAAARGLHVAAILSVLGTAAIRALVAPAALRGLDAEARRRVLRPQAVLLHLSVAVALTTALVWLVIQAAAMSGASGVGDALAAIPVVLGQTVFGNAMIARMVLLALVAACARVPWLAVLLAAGAAAAQAWMGHAAGVREIALPLSVILHMIAAGMWLGGLLPLTRLVSALPPERAGVAAWRFSPLGIVCVVAMAGTAIVQGRELVGGVPGMLGTAYGSLAAVKLALFLVLIGIAAINRAWLTPRIAAGSVHAVRWFRLSIALEAVIGLAIVMTASRLAGLYPGAHEQAEWPFAWRLELANAFDPDLRGEILPALAVLGAAAALIVASAFWRRIRLVGLCAALIAGALALPHLSPLVVPAYPTSFYESLTEFSAGSIARGATLFARNCVACHGEDGRGGGPAGKGLRIPPADLTADHIWTHVDGELFWWLSHGIEDPEGGLSMPGFASLSASDRWSLIDFVRARAAGAEIASQRRWPFPVLAPGIAAICSDRRVLSNDDLRGRMWRVVFGAAAPAAAIPTILLVSRPEPGACIADDDAARRAFAIVAGVDPAAADGTQVLIDAEGWLRAVAAPRQALDLSIAARPLPPPAGGHHH